MNHADRGHAQWSASASARNFACPGAIALIESLGIEDREGKAAAWGTACHQVAEMCLRDGRDAVDHLGETVKTKEHSLVFDDVMAECTQAFLDYVRGRMREYRIAVDPDGDRPTLLIEQHFDLAPIDPPMQAGGTGDAVLLFPAWGLIEIVDLKTGKGWVDANENKQLRTYALGAMIANPGPWSHVRATIVQPRGGGEVVRSETIDFGDLFDWTTDLLAAMTASSIALGERDRLVDKNQWARAYLRPGDHCQSTFCPARAHCPALEAKALAAARTFFKPEGEIAPPPDPADIPVDKLAAILDAADMLEGWLNAVRQRARELTEAGIVLGEEGRHYILVPKQARRKWTVDDPYELVVELSRRTSIARDSFLDWKALSPAQVEKMLGKPSANLVADLWTSESSGTNLVRADKTTRTALPPPAQRFFKPETE